MRWGASAKGRLDRARVRARGFRKPRAHFLHIGKTAGTAVRSTLGGHETDGLYWLQLHGHDAHLSDIPDEDWWFFVARDPIPRFVSAFYSRQRQGRPRYFTPWSEGEAEAFARFETANQLAEAIGTPEGDRAMGSILHVSESYRFFLGDVEPRLDRLLFVPHQDRMDADFPELCRRLGLPALTLPSEDVAAHRNPATVDRRLSEVAVANLREFYAEDLALLRVVAET